RPTPSPSRVAPAAGTGARRVLPSCGRTSSRSRGRSSSSRTTNVLTSAQHVGAIRPDRVVPGSADDRVAVTVPCVDRVVSGAGEDDVPAGAGALDEVAAGGPGDRARAFDRPVELVVVPDPDRDVTATRRSSAGERERVRDG